MTLTEKEEKVLNSIKIPSENDPTKPEFPPNNPKWPSTPTIQIKVEGFSSVWLKDESVNPTGTHKDRMAWEMIVTYKNLLESKKHELISSLPQMSIISSGSAAFAIQSALKKYNLPNLKVLMDYRTKKETKAGLHKIGCEIYDVDLTKKEFTSKDILELTNNSEGIDITSDDSLGPFDTFYDWMSYDIINQDADYILTPYGIGHLYENIITVVSREVRRSPFQDKRLQIEIKRVKQMHFIGATTNNPITIADKLYSPHLPFTHDKNWIKLSTSKGFIGKESGVKFVQEKFLVEAMKIAKNNNITCEPSGIAGLALLLQIKDKIPKDKKILIVNTGKIKISS
jgi:hypothetical protein